MVLRLFIRSFINVQSNGGGKEVATRSSSFRHALDDDGDDDLDAGPECQKIKQGKTVHTKKEITDVRRTIKKNIQNNGPTQEQPQKPSMVRFSTSTVTVDVSQSLSSEAANERTITKEKSTIKHSSRKGKVGIKQTATNRSQHDDVVSLLVHANDDTDDDDDHYNDRNSHGANGDSSYRWASLGGSSLVGLNRSKSAARMRLVRDMGKDSSTVSESVSTISHPNNNNNDSSHRNISHTTNNNKKQNNKQKQKKKTTNPKDNNNFPRNLGGKKFGSGDGGGGGYWRKLINDSDGEDDDSLYQRQQDDQRRRLLLHKQQQEQGRIGSSSRRLLLSRRNLFSKSKSQSTNAIQHLREDKKTAGGDQHYSPSLMPEQYPIAEFGHEKPPTGVPEETCPVSTSHDCQGSNIMDLTPPEEEIVFLDDDDDNGMEANSKHTEAQLIERHVEVILGIDGTEEIVVATVPEEGQSSQEPPSIVDSNDDDSKQHNRRERKPQDTSNRQRSSSPPGVNEIVCQVDVIRSRSDTSNLSDESLSSLSGDRPNEVIQTPSSAVSTLPPTGLRLSGVGYSSLGHNGARNSAVTTTINQHHPMQNSTFTQKQIQSPPPSSPIQRPSMEFHLKENEQQNANVSLQMAAIGQGILRQLLPEHGSNGEGQTQEHTSSQRRQMESLSKSTNHGPFSATLAAPSKCLVLLMDPQRRIFEVIPAFFHSDNFTVGDLLEQIPQQATDYRLKFQEYTGLAHNGMHVAARMVPLQGILKENPEGRPLFAVPVNYSASQIELFATTLLENPKVIRMIQDHQALLGMSSHGVTTASTKNGGIATAVMVQNQPITPRKTQIDPKGMHGRTVPTSIATTSAIANISPLEFKSRPQPRNHTHHGSKHCRTQSGSSTLSSKSPLFQRLMSLTTTPSPLSTPSSLAIIQQPPMSIAPVLPGEPTGPRLSRRTTHADADIIRY